jgi:hypothetical protein
MAKKNTKRAQITDAVAMQALAKASKLDVVTVTGRAKELFEDLDAVTLSVAATEKRLADLLSKEEVALTLDDLRQELDDAKVARKREEDEYRYQRDRDRQADEDTVSDELAAREVQLNQAQKGIDEAAAELQRILKLEATFEDRVKADVAKQVGAISRDMKHAAELETAKHGAEVTILKAEVASSTAAMAALQSQVAALTAQLTQARQDVVKTAQDAVSGASAAKAQAEILANLGQLRASGRDGK